MDDLDERYHERLLHWIWESLHFELSGLHTAQGQSITILDPGDQNPTDGPDFVEARLQIGDLAWHGAVEFHWSIKDWERHQHHTDKRYNCVVLHVVYHDPAGKHIARKDGSEPFTLYLRPHLPDNLEELLSAFQRPGELPCSGQLHYISDEAIKRQFEKAHREYFETKADFLLQFYDPSLPPANAWKRALTLGLFDGLGISLNRDPMVEMGRQLWSKIDDTATQVSSCDDLQAIAQSTGGFNKEKNRPDKEIDWNYKGCRPNNRPELRLQQAAAMMWQIRGKSLNHWYKQPPEDNWRELLHSVDTNPGIGRERADILYGVVFLPALWLLGNLFHIPDLKQSAFEQWLTHDAQLPSSLFKLFEHSVIPPEIYQKKLGAVYQLKHYCKPRRCDQCMVLKEIISS